MLQLKRVANIPHSRAHYDSHLLRSNYWNNGFTIIPQVYTKKECNLLKQTIESDPSINSNVMPMVDSSGKESKLTLWFELGDDLYSMFARSSSIFHAVQTLIDTEPYMFHSKIMLKEPRIGGSWDFHQDFGYWYEQGGTIPDQLLSVMIPIDNHNIHNGCLQVLRGSHKFGRITHGLYNDQNGVDPQRLKVAMDECELVNCELNAGDMLIFHSLLIHGSPANYSDNWRRALIIGYAGRYAPIYKKNDTDFVLPGYTPIDVRHDSEILSCGVRPHSQNRNDFFTLQDNIKSFTPTESL